ncbi:hypothetical protein ACFW9D_37525 [Streptomyces sp. NPDC059524]|uniref:hypothetical protein n=1 Tax=Streptomyces sp. NPDC059524 TaxID=3346856 RepID=UPI0036A9BFDB
MDSMDSSVTPAPPMVLPRLRAGSWRALRALHLSGQEPRADIAGLQFLGEHGAFDAAGCTQAGP